MLKVTEYRCNKKEKEINLTLNLKLSRSIVDSLSNPIWEKLDREPTLDEIAEILKRNPAILESILGCGYVVTESAINEIEETMENS